MSGERLARGIRIGLTYLGKTLESASLIEYEISQHRAEVLNRVHSFLAASFSQQRDEMLSKI